MPATETVSRNPLPLDSIYQTIITRLEWAWTSTALGVVSVASDYAISGRVVRVVFVPDTVAVPSPLYDVTLLDSEGVDVLMGFGANRSAVNTEQIFPYATYVDGANNRLASEGITVNSVLTLTIAAAGNAMQGTVIVYVE